MKSAIPHKFSNRLHTAALMAAMAGLLGALGWFMAGPGGLKLALMTALVWFFFSPALPARMIMRACRAHRLLPGQAPELFHITHTLARRAGLEKMPDLYLLPEGGLNAFAAGGSNDPAIGVSQGLVRLLDRTELAGILGHEITHLQHNDTRVMALAGVFGRVTGAVSLVGQVLMVLFLPVLISDPSRLPLLPFMLMVFAPALSLLIQLALSRTREYAADMGAAQLTGNPRFLASALAKIETVHRQQKRRFFFPARMAEPNPMMRTHPPTEERIRRLLSLPRTRRTGQPLYRRPAHRPMVWT